MIDLLYFMILYTQLYFILFIHLEVLCVMMFAVVVGKVRNNGYLSKEFLNVKATKWARCVDSSVDGRPSVESTVENKNNN